MMLMLLAFVGGMLFEHFVFHKIEDYIVSLHDKIVKPLDPPAP